MRDVLQPLFRMLLLGAFVLCCLFWLSVFIYSVKNFATGGTAGVRQWIMHIDLGHSDPLTYVPDWGLIFAKMVIVALFILLLGFANRRVRKKACGKGSA